MTDKMIYRLFKYSIDILEERKAPEWITEHPEIKKLKTVEKSFAQFGIQSFRDKVNLTPAHDEVLKKRIQEVLKGIANACQEIKYEISTKGNDLISQPEGSSIVDFHGFLTKFQYALANMMSNAVLTMPSEVRLHNFVVRAGQNVTRAYSYVVAQVMNFNKKLNANISFTRLDDIHEVKIYNSSINKNDKDYFIVFNDKEEGLWDICTISERGISSCQAWDDEHESYNRNLIGSILSRNIGTIYLTSGKATPKGDSMMRRCIIRIVINPETQKPAIFIDKMYDNYSEEVMNLFKSSLQKRSNVPVYSYMEYEGPDATQMPAFMDEEDPIIPKLDYSERPYKDTFIRPNPRNKSMNVFLEGVVHDSAEAAGKELLDNPDTNEKFTKYFKEMLRAVGYKVYDDQEGNHKDTRVSPFDNSPESIKMKQEFYDNVVKWFDKKMKQLHEYRDFEENQEMAEIACLRLREKYLGDIKRKLEI